MNRFVKQGVSDADMAEHVLKEWLLPRMEVWFCMYITNIHSYNFLFCVGPTSEN